ncbi:MAG TPA: CPBP family intramembrane glutamic endopeptidase [Terriglobia bacterium]|nr:CPBP family intramembrane glutamic endopeptidase [Terriglobia bacterium]
MSKLTCYLALFSLPVVFLLVLNPVEFWWGFKTAGKPVPMPPDVDRSVTIGGRYTFLAKEAMLIALMWIFMRANSVSATSIGLWSSHWKFDLAVGCLGAVALIGIQVASSRITKSPLGDAGRMRKLYGYHGRLLFWIPANIFGPVAEEFWRAFCIFAFVSAGYSVSVAVVLTALAFGLGHIGLGLPAALAVATVGLGFALLYTWTGSLLAPFVAHSFANLHILYQAKCAPEMVAHR